MSSSNTEEEDRRLQPGDRDFVGALATGLDIIAAFDQDHPRMTLSEVAQKVGIDRAKARRFLLTLHGLGYMRKRDRQFELTPRALGLGYAYLASNDYLAVIQQYLEHITRATGESSSMGCLDGSEVVYIARSAASHRLMTMSLSVGSRLPALMTSMGRVLLALTPEQLDRLLAREPIPAPTAASLTDIGALRQRIVQVRQQGYCILDQELESGLRSLAVPVYSRRGRLLGALNISTNAARVSAQRLEQEFLPLLQDTARAIAETID